MSALAFKWRLRRLHRQMVRAQRPVEAAIAKAEAARDNDEYGALVAEFFHVSEESEDEIGRLWTARLLRDARELMVPIPETSNAEFWMEAKRDGGRYLSAAGVTHLRSAIRQERKERREAASFWSAILFGLLGLLVALAAVLVDAN